MHTYLTYFSVLISVFWQVIKILFKGLGLALLNELKCFGGVQFKLKYGLRSREDKISKKIPLLLIKFYVNDLQIRADHLVLQ